MDLGTANTVIFQNDQIVLDEPSIVAIDNNKGTAIALGQTAKMMQEKENPGIKTVRPMKDGVIADFNAAEMMIRGFIKQVNSMRRSIFTPNIKMVVGIPSGSTEVEIRAVRDSAEHAGGRDVYLIYEPMASALGIGLDVEAPKGNMVVDIPPRAAKAPQAPPRAAKAPPAPLPAATITVHNRAIYTRFLPLRSPFLNPAWPLSEPPMPRATALRSTEQRLPLKPTSKRNISWLTAIPFRSWP